MKIKILYAIAIVALMAVTACDDTTDSAGNSITDNKDKLDVTSATYDVASQSVEAGAVFSRNTTGYVGKVRDPETGTYVTGNFMTQFHTFENFAFPSKDSLVVVNQKGDTIIGGKEILADSCTVGLYYTSYYGDSLANMTLAMKELSAPMSDSEKYYSNQSPETEGLIRTGGINKSKTYTLTDLSVSESDRNNSSYMASISLKLNDPYTAKDGKTYKNYGTYIMNQYYEHPEYFKNSYTFAKNVCPGFYFKNKAGLGSMAYVTVSQMNVYFKYRNDSTYVGVANFAGTQEVLQTTDIENKNIENLVNDNTCTYVKSPAGIYTELELPVKDIFSGHENDTLNSAKIVLTKMNKTVDSKYSFSEPSTLLMVSKDNLKSFFEGEELPDYKTSFIAYNSSSLTTDYGTYTFNNIAGLISHMADERNAGVAGDPDWEAKHPDWNKVLVVPVTLTTTKDSNSQTVIVKVVNDMSLSSVKLQKGSSTDSKIKVDVIYSKFKQK